ncbi:MAG: response regulator [Bacteroidia bacterium]
MKKLNHVLLVEDDDTINFYNEFLLTSRGLTDSVSVAENGREALEYLSKAGNGEAQVPDLILLDINMPVMNGFEFIEQYERLPEHWKSKILVVMLTTSLHPDDMNRAKQHPVIAEYFYKPLMETKLSELVERYF